MLVPQNPHTFAQHPAEGELLLWDKDVLQLLLQFIADAQAIHCREEVKGKWSCSQTHTPAYCLPPAFHPQHSAWIFHTVAISSTSNLGCPFSLLQDLSRFRHFSWINELVKGSLSFSFYAAPALTCSFNAFRPFSIERPGCPEVYSWLPSGHDTVKGLPKEKPRTSGKLQGPVSPPPSLATVPLPYPNLVSLRLFRSRMRAKAAAVIRAVSTPRTTGTQDVRLWGGPCLPVRGKSNVMSWVDTKMSF